MGLAGGVWRNAAARRRLLAMAVLVAAGMVVLALWAPPSAWRWAREHLLTVGAAGPLIGIVGLVVQFLVRRLERRDAADERRRARDRAVMLKRVRNRWIKGVLDRSLTEEARIRLGLTRRPEVIARPAMLTRQPGQAAEPLPAGTSVSAVFAGLDGGLLILGAPGSGKTTAMLELARDLLEHAEDDQMQPVPVVFNLSSWTARRPPLAEWLIDELHIRYDVPRTIAERWVAGGEILPLLDGLDEVAKTHRARCVEAINAFRAERGTAQIVVCSRTEEYTAAGGQLRLDEAVELQPPTHEQISEFLQEAGAALADVRAALEADQSLWEFLQSPLVLNVVAFTYQDQPADALRATGAPEQRLAALFTAYIKRMFEHRRGRYDPGRMLHWLAWLAQQMRQHNQTEFHLDRLMPDWLSTTTAQRFATLSPVISGGIIAGLIASLGYGLVGGLNYGLVYGLAVGLIAGLFAGLRETEPVKGMRWSWERIHVGLRGGLVAGLIIGLVSGLVRGLNYGFVDGVGYGFLFVLLFGLFAGLRKTEPVEEVRWSLSRLFVGLSAGLIVGLIIGLISGLVGGLIGQLGGELADEVSDGLALGPAVGLFAGLVPGLVKKRATPNEGIHRSARYALAIGLGVGVFYGLVGLLFFELDGRPFPASVHELAGDLADGLAVGLIVGLFGGGLACLQHLAMRCLLAHHGYAPLRYVHFLNDATERLFLRRAGSGYLFVHRLLLEYFADLVERR